MIQSPDKLVETPSEAYSDPLLQRQYAQLTEHFTGFSLTEALAAYVVREVEALYDPDSDESQNLHLAASLERSAHVLQGLAAALRG